MCLFPSVFVTLLHSSAAAWLPGSDVFLPFTAFPVCPPYRELKGCNTHPDREGGRWHSLDAVLYCFLSRGPTHAEQSCDCFSTFLPSFLVDPRHSKLVGYHGGGAFCEAQKFWWGQIDKQILTCTLEWRRVMGQEFLKEVVQVTGF